MARVAMPASETVDDPAIREIFAWVTEVEGAVPNHFRVELNFPELLKAKLGTTRVLWQMGELSLPEVQHIGILVGDGECDRLGGVVDRFVRLGFKFELVIERNRVARTRGRTVAGGLAGADPGGQAAARKLRKQLGQRLVEALAGLPGPDHGGQ